MCSWNGVHRRNLRGLVWRASCGQALPERGDITTAFSQLAYIYGHKHLWRFTKDLDESHTRAQPTTNETFFTLSDRCFWLDSCLFACLFFLFSVHNLYSLIVYYSKLLFFNFIGWAAFQELLIFKNALDFVHSRQTVRGVIIMSELYLWVSHLIVH